MISEALPLLLLEDAVNEVRVPVKMIARSLRIVKRIHLLEAREKQNESSLFITTSWTTFNFRILWSFLFINRLMVVLRNSKSFEVIIDY